MDLDTPPDDPQLLLEFNSSAPKIALETLPYELLLTIFEDTCLSFNDQVQLLHTSRTLRSAFEKAFFRHVSLSWPMRKGGSIPKYTEIFKEPYASYVQSLKLSHVTGFYKAFAGLVTSFPNLTILTFTHESCSWQTDMEGHIQEIERGQGYNLSHTLNNNHYYRILFTALQIPTLKVLAMNIFPDDESYICGLIDPSQSYRSWLPYREIMEMISKLEVLAKSPTAPRLQRVYILFDAETHLYKYWIRRWAADVVHTTAMEHLARVMLMLRPLLFAKGSALKVLAVVASMYIGPIAVFDEWRPKNDLDWEQVPKPIWDLTGKKEAGLETVALTFIGVPGWREKLIGLDPGVEMPAPRDYNTPGWTLVEQVERVQNH